MTPPLSPKDSPLPLRSVEQERWRIERISDFRCDLYAGDVLPLATFHPEDFEQWNRIAITANAVLDRLTQDYDDRIYTLRELRKLEGAEMHRLTQERDGLRKEIQDSFALAESQHAAEKLSGNVVKLEYWKGELAVLHRLRRLLSSSGDSSNASGVAAKDSEEKEARPETTHVLQNWLKWLSNKAEKNIAKWGIQDFETLGLAIAEESGELAQAILQARYEKGERGRISMEAVDLGALCLQVLACMSETHGAENFMDAMKDILSEDSNASGAPPITPKDSSASGAPTETDEEIAR